MASVSGDPVLTDCRGMQNCFRAHPDVYGAELEDEEAEAEASVGAGAPAPSEQSQPSASEIDASSHPEEKQSRAKEVNAEVKAVESEKGETAESESLLPKATHDAEEKNNVQKEEK